MAILSQIERNLDRVEASLKRVTLGLVVAEMLFRHDPGSDAMRIRVNRCRGKVSYWEQQKRAAVIAFVHEPVRGVQP